MTKSIMMGFLFWFWFQKPANAICGPEKTTKNAWLRSDAIGVFLIIKFLDFNNLDSDLNTFCSGRSQGFIFALSSSDCLTIQNIASRQRRKKITLRLKATMRKNLTKELFWGQPITGFINSRLEKNSEAVSITSSMGTWILFW